MIEPSRHPQLSFAEGLIQEEVGPLWEEWMRQVDEVLADRELVQITYEALARRWPQSRTRGRPATPAEVVLRMLLLKHMRNWSYRTLEREVRANLVYRQFTRVGAQKVPDAKTLGRLALALGPEIIEQIHRRVIAIACEKQIVRGRRLRVDTTVVETDIHYPTDSSLLGDGVRVLTRTMKRITAVAGRAGTRLRDRTRAVGYQVRQIARSSRSRVAQGQERLKVSYRKLLYHTARVVGQAKRFAEEVASGRKRARVLLDQISLEADRAYLERMIPLVRQVMHQTRERIFKGNTHVPGKLVSLFEPHTEVIRKGKAAKPTEFGKMVGRPRRPCRQSDQHRPRARRSARLHQHLNPLRYAPVRGVPSYISYRFRPLLLEGLSVFGVPTQPISPRSFLRRKVARIAHKTKRSIIGPRGTTAMNAKHRLAPDRQSLRFSRDEVSSHGSARFCRKHLFDPTSGVAGDSCP